MAHLVLVSGGEPGLRLPLDRDKTVLGRDADCHIVITQVMVRRGGGSAPVPSISRWHAMISREDGKYCIEDGDGKGKESRKGTFVNDRKTPFPGRVQLHDGDRIRICDFVCTFHQPPDSSFSVEHSIDRSSSVQYLQAQPADRLRVILEISNSLSHTLEIDSLLPRLIDSLLELFPQADRGFIILRDETTGQLIPHVSRTRQAGDHPGAPFSHAVVQQCLDSVQAILGNDLPKQFPGSESIRALPMRSLLMCAPLWAQDGQALGVIQLDGDGPKKKFSPEDLNLLLGVASQASIALSNARLHRQALLHQARVRELELAGKVQLAMLPRLPDIPGYDFYAYYKSAQEVGGDYYDFIPLPQQRLAVLLGDVAGKGVPAALVRVQFSVEARACLLTEPEPAAAVSKLNALLSKAALADRFVTLALAVLDHGSHTIALVNAGHPSPLLLRRAAGTVEEAVPLEVAGPPIGIDDGHAYNSCQVSLEPGDGLILFSDGVTDAQDAQGRAFRPKGIRTVLQDGPWSAPKTGERLIEAVQRHGSGRPQTDDIAVVCFSRAGV
ncbi:MAG TPA: SpoIIE family protein phosphatase [Gemmataceae bacterium]|nr:SpoIIE family protein phosphatase [Gemmataceae bacterium]